MIDNLNQVIPLLSFESADDFYYLQILQRKKDNPKNTHTKVVKNYFIKSVEELTDKYEEIKILCSSFNARAMLRLNKRSFEKIALLNLRASVDLLIGANYTKARSSYDHTVGVGHSINNKKWLVDIDEVSPKKSISVINTIRPYEVKNKVIAELPTKNGVHLVTTPFDLKTFKNLNPGVSVHKDSPINLYIP